MTEIRTLSTRIIYENKWLTLREDSIQRKSGKKGIYSVVEKPDFAVILPIQDRHVFLIEQFRYPFGKRSLELPQGAWESNPDADPQELAAGELQEETGLVASDWTYIGYQYLAAGFSNQGYHMFMATGLTQREVKFDSEEEGLVTLRMPLSEFEECLRQGSIRDASTTNTFCYARFKGLV